MAGDGGGDYFSDLTTAPIFDDAVYCSEALDLAEGQNENTLDEQTAMSAREAGIEGPHRYLFLEADDISKAMSTLTVDSVSERRSSMSIYSRETQSTGVTSYLSRTSKDNPFFDSTSPALRSPASYRGLSAVDCSETTVERFRPDLGHKHSSSNTLPANSFLAMASPTPKPTPQKRKSGLFSMFRRDTSACPSRSHRGSHGKPSSPTLDCGHSLSKYAIRVHVQEALENTEPVAPTCCGKPLPRSVLEMVLSKEETDLVAADSFQRPVYNTQRDSGYSEQAMSCVDLPIRPKARSPPAQSFVTAPVTPCRDFAREDEETLNRALASEAFATLKNQQRAQFLRVSQFESNQRKALAAYHQWSLRKLASRFETTRANKPKQHALELERLDETQIVAEHDLRKSHDQETQNVATALKYMEAYCSGASPTCPDTPQKAVTDDDRKKLARQRMLQEKLPQKHDSAINVLRARQEKDAKLKVQKQQRELQQLAADYERDTKAEELRFAKDMVRLDSIIETRRKRLATRWDLKFEVWGRDWETQHKTTLHGRLPQEEWPQAHDHRGSIEPSSSLALYIQVTA
ncbi:hypothetical protein BDV96DRAFT_651373 [Lophiotrema nucula]|uniref:Uncharacterized protein n=1 Tax=Lophiotrema nucula TaxID=690887 RepID=A0A6A5YSW1_9PLEO|nr:hypothetical protein BDV96DRAFT_651373 [Lophiotrema nucula]